MFRRILRWYLSPLVRWLHEPDECGSYLGRDLAGAYFAVHDSFGNLVAREFTLSEAQEFAACLSHAAWCHKEGKPLDLTDPVPFGR